MPGIGDVHGERFIFSARTGGKRYVQAGTTRGGTKTAVNRADH